MSKRTTDQKIRLFMSLFHGLSIAYGTYDHISGRYRQVKKQVNRNVIYDHLKGNQSYGFYPVVGSKTSVGIVDFDNDDPYLGIQFIQRAQHYDIPAYLERSKSKGYHVWIFFHDSGILANKARLVMNHILDDIDSLDTEIFPKQDFISTNGYYGNFINAPLFGRLVPKSKTIFIESNASLKPFKDQWTFLETVEMVNEQIIDRIIEINELDKKSEAVKQIKSGKQLTNNTGYGLPICIRTILQQGVTFDQRVATFRIAVHLKRIGIPYEFAVIVLVNWKKKNKPVNGQRIITSEEVEEQIDWAYKKNYTGFGCQEKIIQSFCDLKCPVFKRSNS